MRMFFVLLTLLGLTETVSAQWRYRPYAECPPCPKGTCTVQGQCGNGTCACAAQKGSAYSATLTTYAQHGPGTFGSPFVGVQATIPTVLPAGTYQAQLAPVNEVQRDPITWRRWRFIDRQGNWQWIDPPAQSQPYVPQQRMVVSSCST